MPLSTALDTVAALGALSCSISSNKSVSGTTVLYLSRNSSSVDATLLEGDLYSVLGAAAHTTWLWKCETGCLLLFALCNARHTGVPSSAEDAIINCD